MSLPYRDECVVAVRRARRGSGSARERRPGVWEVRVVVGFDAGRNRSIQKSFTVYGDHAAAARRRAELVEAFGVRRVERYAATATLTVETPGEGLIEITREAARFLGDVAAGTGALLIFLRHTSASLTIQENADPDVRTDLVTALRRLAPEDVGWIHDTEGADDMPSHIKSILTQVSLTIPILGGKLALGTWQGIYLWEHRARPTPREFGRGGPSHAGRAPGDHDDLGVFDAPRPGSTRLCRSWIRDRHESSGVAGRSPGA